MYALTYLDKPLVKSASSALRIKIGTGLAGMTNPYDAEKNFQNTALSGRIVCHAGRNVLDLSVYRLFATENRNYDYPFFEWCFKASKLGVNFPALKLGVSYQSRPHRFSRYWIQFTAVYRIASA